MFDIGWSELLVIGVVALIVVGPKDLPGMFRTLGRFTAKAKGMAREFQRAMDDAADEAGVKDVAKDLKNATSASNLGLDKIKDAATKFESWEPGKSSTVKGAETAKLAEERAQVAKKIHDATAKAATDRKASEAAKAQADAVDTPKKPAAKKPAAKKPAAPKAKAAAKAPTAKAAPKAAAKPKIKNVKSAGDKPA